MAPGMVKVGMVIACWWGYDKVPVTSYDAAAFWNYWRAKQEDPLLFDVIFALAKYY